MWFDLGIYVVGTFICLAGLYRWWQLHHVLRNVREIEFLPMDARSLPSKTLKHFQTYTPALFQLQFDLIGDFRMKPRPVEVFDRIFLSQDGQTLASICSVLEGGGVSLISVLSNGLCIHSVSMANPHPERTANPSDRILVCYLPDASVEVLHDFHRRAIGDLSELSGSKVLRFRKDQFREVLVYDQRVFNRWRFRHGGLNHEPPAPDFSTLLAKHADLV
jgi:hypothetical protein